MRSIVSLGLGLALLCTAANAAVITRTIVVNPNQGAFVDQGNGFTVADFGPGLPQVGYANDARIIPGLPDHSGLYVGVMEFSLSGVPFLSTSVTSARLILSGNLPALTVGDYYGDGAIAPSDVAPVVDAFTTSEFTGGFPRQYLIVDVTQRVRAYYSIGAPYYGLLFRATAPNFGCTTGTLGCVQGIYGPENSDDPFGRADLEITYQQNVPDPPPPPPIVPEPGTWALLTVGLGIVGAGLRRRRVPLAT